MNKGLDRLLRFRFSLRIANISGIYLHALPIQHLRRFNFRNVSYPCYSDVARDGVSVFKRLLPPPFQLTVFTPKIIIFFYTYAIVHQISTRRVSHIDKYIMMLCVCLCMCCMPYAHNKVIHSKTTQKYSPKKNHDYATAGHYTPIANSYLGTYGYLKCCERVPTIYSTRVVLFKLDENIFSTEIPINAATLKRLNIFYAGTEGNGKKKKKIHIHIWNHRLRSLRYTSGLNSKLYVIAFLSCALISRTGIDSNIMICYFRIHNSVYQL